MLLFQAPIMASKFFRLAVVLGAFLMLQLGVCDSFCINTLTRSTCPDLQTVDQFDITEFGGRWYEIGGNGFYKNLEEAGGNCVSADYALLTNATNMSRGVPATIGIVKSYNKQIGPLATSVVQGISIRAAQVCAQTRQICIETHQLQGLPQGLLIVEDLASMIINNFSLEGDGLMKAKIRIDVAVQKINQSIEDLSTNVTQLQIINSKLSQSQGSEADNVNVIANVVANGSLIADLILESVFEIGAARVQIESIAGLLFAFSKAESSVFGENSSYTTLQASVQLYKAASLIQMAEESIPGPLAVIKTTLQAAITSTTMLNVDTSGPSGSVPYLQGQAVQTSTNHSGRLVLSMYNADGVYPAENRSNDLSPGPDSGNYWILATEGKKEDGYNAVLVYGCHELPNGGVKQPLFVLSRQPTLPADVIGKFFNVAATLGIDQECDEPFIFGLQGDSCLYPTLP